MAIRLLRAFQATVDKLNLHPDLKKLVKNTHGLILVSGPTGCGKSSTLAALIQEINLTETRHIITVESPIEYTFRSRRSFIRQREVGRDTPSFEQALHDALREDPDVLMVGEMREPETMRLTLSAAETGHLVLATVHSATCAEASSAWRRRFQRRFKEPSAPSWRIAWWRWFPNACGFGEDLNIRVPECEILMATHAVKNFIRTANFSKLFPRSKPARNTTCGPFSVTSNGSTAGPVFFCRQNPEPPDNEPADTSPSATALPPLLAAPRAEPKRLRPFRPARPARVKSIGLKSSRMRPGSEKS